MPIAWRKPWGRAVRKADYALLARILSSEPDRAAAERIARAFAARASVNPGQFLTACGFP
jgi:hypothetical protein